MSFLNFPIFVLGALAVSVPVIIHLLNKRKFDRVVWAAMRFLKISVDQNQRRIQIEDILLLILRCLVLLLLGVALARPTLGCSAASGMLGHQDVNGVIILDNSYSMSGTDGVRSRFDQAKLAAAQAIDTMPSGSSVAVILASDIASPIIPEPTHDLAKVRRAIADARLCSRGSNLYPALRMAIDTLKGRSSVRKEIYLLTDGQLVAWKQLSEIQKLLDAEKREIRASIIFVGGHEDENVAVSQLRMASGLAAVNRELYFSAEIRNYGSKPAESVRITLRVDNEAPSDEQTISLIPPGGSKTVSLRAKLREEGYHSVTAAIPADHLPADDVRTIAVRAITQAKVLLVDGAPARNPRDDETYYLREALQPVARGARDQYFMKVTTVSSTELDQQKFDGYDAVIVANVADFSQRTLEAFADYLRRGGGLMIFPGEATSPSFYNETLAHKYHFLPATFGPTQGDPARRDRFFTLQNKQFQHPIASIWSDPANGTPASAEFYKAYELVPEEATNQPGDKYAAEAGAPRVVLSFGGGAGDDSMKDKPAVMERNWGLGRVILFASTAGSKWTTLPVAAQGGVFLPLIDRTVASIVQRQDEALNIRVGDTFTFHPGDESIGKEALFFKPGQREEATDSRQIELPRGGAGSGVPTLTYNQTDIAGEYIAKMPYGPPVKFAAQIESDNNESSLDELSKQQSDQLAQVSSVTRWSPGENLGSRIETARTGTELWMHLAWLVLILATGEMFLARWFSRSK